MTTITKELLKNIEITKESSKNQTWILLTIPTLDIYGHYIELAYNPVTHQFSDSGLTEYNISTSAFGEENAQKLIKQQTKQYKCDCSIKNGFEITTNATSEKHKNAILTMLQCIISIYTIWQYRMTNV